MLTKGEKDFITKHGTHPGADAPENYTPGARVLEPLAAGAKRAAAKRRRAARAAESPSFDDQDVTPSGRRSLTTVSSDDEPVASPGGSSGVSTQFLPMPPLSAMDTTVTKAERPRKIPRLEMPVPFNPLGPSSVGGNLDQLAMLAEVLAAEGGQV